MLATYLLEARVGTFLRPDATSRFAYTVIANVLIGTIGAALVIRALVRRAELPHVTTYGIARPLRILILVPLAAVLAGLSGHRRVRQSVRNRSQVIASKDGEMSEWLKEHAWKAKWVRVTEQH